MDRSCMYIYFQFSNFLLVLYAWTRELQLYETERIVGPGTPLYTSSAIENLKKVTECFYSSGKIVRKHSSVHFPYVSFSI
jgi:hypothetical protein